MKIPRTSSQSLTSFIWQFLRLQPWKFFFIFLLSLTWSLDATVWPYLLRLIIDVFTQYDIDRTSAWPALKGLVIFGVLFWFFLEFCFRAKDFLQAQARPKLEADIRMAMFDHIQQHSPKYFNEHFAGSLTNKISDMITQIALLLQNLMVFLPTVVTCAVSIFLFAKINAFFAWVLAIWLMMHFVICFAFARKCVKYSNIHAEARSSLAGKIVDSLTNNFAVNLFFRFQFEKTRIAPWQNDEQTKNFKAQQYTAWMFTLLSIVFLIAIITLFALMIDGWIRGTISTGEVIQIFNTTWNVIFIIWVAGEMMPQFLQSLGIANQALTVMQDPSDVVDSPDASPLSVKQGEIIFENVTFRYGQKKLFENKNIHIKAGEKVGLVGYSGAGKSSFVSLILRFYPVEKGRILIDGHDISKVTLNSLRHQVALIPQDPLLFHRSLEENIRYGCIDATKEQVIAAAKLAHCHEFIEKCPNGYNSLVGERGTKLSGGERQRIAIARAILAAPPILILDEATSALDSVTEKYIQDSLEKIMQNRTTIVIAHRLSTLSKMDRILVLNEGKVAEEGTHLELLDEGGHYARMWHMQAGGFLPDSL